MSGASGRTVAASLRTTITLSFGAPAVRSTGPSEPGLTPGPDHVRRAGPTLRYRSTPFSLAKPERISGSVESAIAAYHGS